MNDDRIVNYMKVRSDHAKTVACVIAVQLFVLAVYFCMYALIAGHVFLSLSEEAGKIIMITVASGLAAGVVVVNFLTVIHGKKVDITRPDSLAMRDGEEVVRIAYTTARPVLIYKITYSIVIVAAGVLVNIILLSFLEDQILAGLYGRIVICLCLSAAVLIAYPCIDRIACYRALLGESHVLYYDRKGNRLPGYIAAFCVPVCICLWYVFRYFARFSDIAWVIFPFVALFALAISFLINIKSDIKTD